MKRIVASRYVRYRRVGKRLYTTQPFMKMFRVTFGYGRILRNSWIIRKHLGRLIKSIRKEP